MHPIPRQRMPNNESDLIALLADVEEQLDATNTWEVAFAAWELEYLADALEDYLTRADEVAGVRELCEAVPTAAPVMDGFRALQERALAVIRMAANDPEIYMDPASLRSAAEDARAAVASAGRVQHLKEARLRRVRGFDEGPE
jgi:hypothetical protein